MDKKTKKKGLFSKVVVSGVILANIMFSIAVLWIFLRTSAEPTALIAAWFGFTTVEVWSLAKIKREKTKKEIEHG